MLELYESNWYDTYDVIMTSSSRDRHEVAPIIGGLRGRVDLPRKPLRRLNECIAYDPRLSTFGS